MEPVGDVGQAVAEGVVVGSKPAPSSATWKVSCPSLCVRRTVMMSSLLANHVEDHVQGPCSVGEVAAPGVSRGRTAGTGR